MVIKTMLHENEGFEKEKWGKWKEMYQLSTILECHV